MNVYLSTTAKVQSSLLSIVANLFPLPKRAISPNVSPCYRIFTSVRTLLFSLSLGEESASKFGFGLWRILTPTEPERII